MPIRIKSIVRDVKSDLITIEEELVEVLDVPKIKGVTQVKIKKTKKYQMKLSEYNPISVYEARQKQFGSQG